MGYKSFEIVLDSPTGSYIAGSNVSGEAVLVLDKPKKVKGLFIKLNGFGKVSWAEYDNKSSAEEEYFCYNSYLFGSENSEKEIPEGRTVYPFSVKLPEGVPSSFEGGHGHVRYCLRACLDRPSKKQEETKMFITVITPIDLNVIPNVKDPVLKESTLSFWCLCCASSPLTLACYIPRSGYLAGESLPLTVDLDNPTNTRISAVIGKLRKEVKWIVHEPKRQERVSCLDLTEFRLGQVAPHSSKSWSRSIELPLLPVVNLELCSIIKINFYLEVRADPAGGHRGPEIKFPLHLGTVGLRDAGRAPQLTPQLEAIVSIF